MIRFSKYSLGIVAFWLVTAVSGCGIYSLNGGSVPPGSETISVELFENNASLIVPTLAQDLTEALKDRFVSQTNLRVVDYDGDLRFSGFVSSYAVAPIAIQGDETAAQNRLTVGVKVKFEVPDHPEMDWDKSFSQFSDFSATASLSDVESALIEDILDKITLDIFNKALSNW